MWPAIVTCIFISVACVCGMPKPPGGTRDTRGAPPRIQLVDAAKYLSKYGYVSKTTASRTLASIESLDPSRLTAPIREFQRLAGLEETGELDGETMRYMTMPRCGVEDKVGASSMLSKGYNGRGKYERKDSNRRRRRRRRRRRKEKENAGKSRTKRYDLQGAQWDKKELTYAIQSFTSDMTKRQVKTAMKKALKLWSDKSSLSFREIADASKADLKISFGSNLHGDAYPFDGSGGTLAHAFFPQSGEAHFDDDEKFSDKGQGTNLLIVAAHEFGHSLGLAHSTVQDSLMAPFYQGYVENFELHPDDVAAIQALYGKNVDAGIERPTRPRATERSKTVRPTKKPRPKLPDLCTTDVDAAISYVNRSRHHTYIFKGSYFYKLDDNGVVKGYPKRIGKHWEKLPGNLDAAAHSARTGYTYFFKGNKVYSYKGTTLRRGFPTTTMDLIRSPKTVLTWGYDGMLYLFKKKNFYKFDDIRGKLYRSVHISRAWEGVPEDIDAAFTWSRNGRKTYFLKGNLYWRFDNKLGAVDPGYPKNFNQQWLGCPKPQTSTSSIRGRPSRNGNKVTRQKPKKMP